MANAPRFVFNREEPQVLLLAQPKTGSNRGRPCGQKVETGADPVARKVAWPSLRRLGVETVVTVDLRNTANCS